jgi:hypothetical protein
MRLVGRHIAQALSCQQRLLHGSLAQRSAACGRPHGAAAILHCRGRSVTTRAASVRGRQICVPVPVPAVWPEDEGSAPPPAPGSGASLEVREGLLDSSSLRRSPAL